MPVIIDGTQGITFPDNSRQYNGYFGFKNRIINGDMRIDQRNAGASGTAISYTVDRWSYNATQAAKGSWQRNAGSVTPPAGFTNYLGFTSSSAYPVLTGDTFYFGQYIEGFNAADLAWGTANAQPVTLSFRVYSSLTGTFGGSITNGTGRSYPFSYSVSAANTWTSVSVTIPGDTSGTWLTNNGIGVGVWFGLGSGATFSGTANAWASGVLVQPTGTVSVVGTNGATFYITGVQLEEGAVSTNFDVLPYTTQLQLCQRYLPAFASNAAVTYLATGFASSASSAVAVIPFQVATRTAPTGISISNSTHFSFQQGGSVFAATTTAFSSASTYQGTISMTTTGLTINSGGAMYFNNASGQLLFTGCEL